MTEENVTKLEGKYATLVTNIAGKLHQNMDSISLRMFRLHMTTYFPNAKNSIAKSSSVIEVFEAISGVKKWNCFSCTAIEEICSKFGNCDKDITKWISDYKNELAGFNATTKIVDYMKSQEHCEALDVNNVKEDKPIQQSMTEYDDQYCNNLQVKLKAPVADKCLDYIDQLWASIRVYLYLPPLPVILKRICKGCIEVIWHIPTRLAQEILFKAQHLTEVASNFEISVVKLNHNILYADPEVSIITFTVKTLVCKAQLKVAFSWAEHTGLCAIHIHQCA